jgi:hypothetical protein
MRVAALVTMVASLIGAGGAFAPAHAAGRSWTCAGGGSVSTDAYWDNHGGGYWSGFATGTGSSSCTALLSGTTGRHDFSIEGFSGDPCWTADAIKYQFLWLTMDGETYKLSRTTEIASAEGQQVEAPTSANPGYEVRGLIMAFRYGAPTPRPIGTYQFTLAGDPGCGSVGSWGDQGFTNSPFNLHMTFLEGLARVTDTLPWPGSV